MSLKQARKLVVLERLLGTLQHWLVVDMRLAGITSIEEANAFPATYPDKHNERFAVEPEREESAFLPAPSPDDLPCILCKRAFRKAMVESPDLSLSIGLMIIWELGKKIYWW